MASKKTSGSTSSRGEAKGSTDKRVMGFLSNESLRRLMSSTTGDGTRIADEAVQRLKEILEDHGKWISTEARKIAVYSGKETIDAEDVKKASVAHFVGMKVSKGGEER